MSRALGLIETRGLVAAIEAADAMVKTANVTIIGKEIIRPALVTIKIKGDVAAVKAAIEAGAEAASKVGEVISVHIIPSPDDQLLVILPERDSIPLPPKTKKEKRPEDIISVQALPVPENAVPSIVPDKVQLSEPEEIKPEHIKPKKERLPKIEKTEPDETNLSAPLNSFPVGSLFDVNNETISRLRKEALGVNEIKEAIVKEKLSIIPDNIDTLNVHQLRHLARGIQEFPIRGREISKAGRQELLNLFKNL